MTVLRVWGVVRSVVLAVLLGIIMHVTVGTRVSLPTFEFPVELLALVPALAVMVVAFPLVDQTPALTLTSTRAGAHLAAARLSGVCAAGVVLFVALAATPWTVRQALMLFVLLAGCIVCAALAGQWYWVPMSILSLWWLNRFALRYEPGDGEVAPWVAGLLLALSGGAYLWSQRHATDGRRPVNA